MNVIITRITTFKANVECLPMKTSQFIHFRSKFFHLVDGVFDLSNAFALLWETWLTDQWLRSVHRTTPIFSDLSQLYTIHQQRSPRVKYAPSYHVCQICALKGPNAKFDFVCHFSTNEVRLGMRVCEMCAPAFSLRIFPSKAFEC